MEYDCVVQLLKVRAKRQNTMSDLRQAPGHKHPLLWGELPPLGCAILSFQDNYQPRYLCQHLRSPLWRLKLTNRQYFTYGLKGLGSFFVVVLLNCIHMSHLWVIFLFVLVCNGWFRIRCCFGCRLLCSKECICGLLNTRVGTLIVANIYLQLIQNRYMFRSLTVLQCSRQHCVQPVASDVEVVGYLQQRLLC